MRLTAGVRKEREYFKQKQELTGCAVELFLLSQVLATASKLKSMRDKDPHILKRDAKEIPQDLRRKGWRLRRESSLKGILRGASFAFSSTPHGEGDSFTQGKQRAGAREPQAWEKVLARRGDKLVSHFVDGSLLNGKNSSACGVLLPESRMLRVLGEPALCLLECGAMRTGTWLSGSCESRGWLGLVLGQGEEGSRDSKMHFCHLEG